ncbi:MAG: tetratricopeptide repeat protein, partial [Acidobacteriota bacterium]|nr:tetratricopeptide repeat protein [Acidobacteriota bacterium]
QELVANLAKIRALTVISGPSNRDYGEASMSVQQIARQLQANAVVEGTLLRWGNKVRITAELVEASTGRYLWADSYEAELGNILQLENKVARAIADHTQIEITPEEEQRLADAPTVDPRAYDDYLKGLYYWNERSVRGLTRATRYFRQAISIDPQYALSYAGLADCYAILGSTVVDAMPPREAAPKAKEAALKAIEINDKLAEAQTALATMQFNYAWDWPAAEQGFKRAIELNPSYATAHQRYSLFLIAMGRDQASLAEIRRARALDPLSISINFSLGWRLYLARHFDQAIEQLRTTVEMDPRFALANMVLGEAYEQKGQERKAIAELEKAVSNSKDSPLMESELGRAYAVAGEREKAEKVLAKLQEESKREYVSPFRLAIVYGGLGEKDLAIGELEKAYTDRANGLIFIKVDPELDSLRSDPRFQRILGQLRLPGLSQANH